MNKAQNLPAKSQLGSPHLSSEAGVVESRVSSSCVTSGSYNVPQKPESIGLSVRTDVWAAGVAASVEMAAYPG